MVDSKKSPGHKGDKSIGGQVVMLYFVYLVIVCMSHETFHVISVLPTFPITLYSTARDRSAN